MSSPNESPEPWSLLKSTGLIFYVLWAFNVLFHIPSFYRTQFRGDENINMALASEMRWDSTHLTVMDLDGAQDLPNSIYTAPLYIHGPLYPYVLKIGQALGSPSAFAFLFANFVMGLYFLHIHWLFNSFRVAPEHRIYGYLSAATCALTLFSTTRMHHDALLGLFVACTIISQVLAYKTQSVGIAIWAGLLATCALNVRCNGILLLPLLVGVHLYYLLVVDVDESAEPRETLFRSDWKERLTKWPLWKVFFVVVAIVGTIGMQHSYRLLWEYGTINPKAILVADRSDPWYQMLAKRTQLMMTWNMVLIAPILLFFVTPAPYRQLFGSLRKGSWLACFLLCFLFLFLVIDFMGHTELRHFAMAMPLLYCCLPFLFAGLSASMRPIAQALFVVTVFGSVITGYKYTVVLPNDVIFIIPWIYDYLPGLLPLYGPTGI